MNSFELDGILEKKDVIRYTLASVPILDLAIRHMSVVQEAGSDRKLSFSAEAAQSVRLLRLSMRWSSEAV